MNDKLLHALAGALIVALLWPLAGPVGVFAAVAAGLAKELYDSFYPTLHTVDANDAVATVLGGAAAVAWLSGATLLRGVLPW